MKRNLSLAILIFAANAAAQVVIVTGTGDPKIDIPAVQAAVDKGGQVVLAGRFSFDAPPTVPKPTSFQSPGLATILISKAVSVSGTLDDQGQLTAIVAGTVPFYVDAPGSPVAIQGIHFVRPKGVAIAVAAVAGLAVSYNRIEGLDPDSSGGTGILISTSVVVPSGTDLGNAANISGNLWVAFNEIDMQAQGSATRLGIVVLAVGKSPDKEADLYIWQNTVMNANERPIDIYSVGGRAYIERNTIVTTTGAGINVAPSGDVIHIVGPGSFLIAHNAIECNWTSGMQAGIRLQTRSGQTISRAVVFDNDVNMAAPAGTTFGALSAAIEVRGAGDGTMVFNNRIRGRANFALAVANQGGAPQGTTFLLNDLQGFTSAQADIFLDAGATNTVVMAGKSKVEDHGTGTVMVPTP
jgi:hypothetical protein